MLLLASPPLHFYFVFENIYDFFSLPCIITLTVWNALKVFKGQQFEVNLWRFSIWNYLGCSFNLNMSRGDNFPSSGWLESLLPTLRVNTFRERIKFHSVVRCCSRDVCFSCQTQLLSSEQVTESQAVEYGWTNIWIWSDQAGKMLYSRAVALKVLCCFVTQSRSHRAWRRRQGSFSCLLRWDLFCNNQRLNVWPLTL